MNAVEAAIRVGGTISIETRHWTGHARQPGRRRRTGVLHQFSVLRVLERALALAVVVEMKFVDRVVAERPGVGNIPLLKAFSDDTAEARDVGAGQFEERKRLQRAVVVKVVVDAEVLLVSQPVIDLHCEVVAALGLRRNGFDGVAAIARSGHELHQINGRRIQAGKRNLVVRENARVNLAIGNWRSDRSRASVAIIEDRRICESSRKRRIIENGERLRGAGQIRGIRDRYVGRRDALANAASFIGREEEGAILLDRAAESSTKLILVELRLGAGSRKTIAIRVEHFIAEKFIDVTVKRVGARLGDDVDDGTGVAAVLCVESVGKNAEFLNAVGRGL